jgi:myosin heavy subunit
MEKQALFNESKEKDEEIEELKKELNMSRCQSENLDFQNTFPFSLKKDQKIEQLKEEIVKINKIAEFLMTENKRLKNTNFFFQSFERMEVDFTPKSQSKVSSEVSSQSSHDVNFQHLQEKVAKLEEIIKEKEESAQSLKTEIFSMKKSCNELEIKNQCLQQDLNQKANLLRVYKSLIPRKTVTSRTIQDLPYTLAKEQDELDISELNHSIELSVSNYKKRNLKRNPKVFEEFKIQSFDLNDIEN